MRIVLDTNVYIAAALQSGFSEAVLKALISSPDLSLITSEQILKELEQKLKEKFRWPKEDIDLFITRIKKTAHVIGDTEKLSVIHRDPEDDKILECALAGNADIIVSLDRDLIVLKKFKGVAIIHPKTFSWIFPKYFNKHNKRKS